MGVPFKVGAEKEVAIVPRALTAEELAVWSREKNLEETVRILPQTIENQEEEQNHHAVIRNQPEHNNTHSRFKKVTSSSVRSLQDYHRYYLAYPMQEILVFSFLLKTFLLRVPVPPIWCRPFSYYRIRRKQVSSGTCRFCSSHEL